MKTVNYDTVKVLKRRDSATSVLRKMGINSRDYDLFIEKMEDGRLACKVAMAEMHLENLKKQVKSKTTKKPKAAKKPKEKRITISSLCRDMILDGATNDEIFATLQEKYGEERFGPDKRHYPVWYRCELRRKGALPPAFDRMNQDPNAVHKFED